MLKKIVAMMTIMCSVALTSIAVFGASAAVQIVTDPNVVTIGTRGALIGDIVIKEGLAGALMEDKVLYLQGEYLTFEEDLKAEVIAGDVRLGKVEVQDDIISIAIEKDSSEPSEIRLSNLRLFNSEALPEGNYQLKVITKEDDTFKNNIYGEVYGDTEDKFSVESMTLLKNFVMVSVPDDKHLSDSSLHPDQPVIIVPEVAGIVSLEEAVDTMVPVRDVTQAFAPKSQIIWDDETQKVTIQMGSRMAQIQIGSDLMIVDGVEVYLDQPAELIDGKASITLKDLCFAFGISENRISFDPNTNTITVQ
ncbi:MAG: copper amine oxidase N-terminal domain-containing protein [Clostridiales bacterium]|nr:copper amine oxidase N-terminal domain-containing protein [Clostridiales bacterium]